MRLVALSSGLALALSLFVSFSIASPTGCQDPQGIQWAIYPNSFGADPAKPANYPEFDPTVIKGETPYYNGVTGSIGISGGQYGYFYAYGDYDDYVYNQDFIIDHRGYIKPMVTGFYNFTILADDDIVEFWVGRKAYSGWTRKNSDLTYSTSKKPSPPITGSFKLVKNRYTPMRIIWAQASGPFNLQVSLVDPSGNEILGTGTSPNNNIVQYSCKTSKAPPYPAYGSE